MLKERISAATAKNWEKLNINSAGRLEKRANKSRSQKKIIPEEYINNAENRALIEKIAEFARNADVKDVMYTLALSALKAAGIAEKENVRTVMREYGGFSCLDNLANITLPQDEYDFLGAVYQSLLREGEKNTLGSYYTPKKIVDDMMLDIEWRKNPTFLDPCCGSGAYILGINGALPENIFGFDSDPVAVMLAKVNLLMKYPEADFLPQIYCADFLSLDACGKKYDCICTNPPWGAALERGKKGESFSCFFKKAYSQLKDGGKIRFLFPESVLNVRTHKNIRRFLLDYCNIEKITVYNNDFSGVATRYVNISAKKEKQNGRVVYRLGEHEERIDTKAFEMTDNFTFNMLSDEDVHIINKVKKLQKYDLSESVWALGVVTGDNKNKLFADPRDGAEAIYTGREIERYRLKNARNYIVYDPSKLQQTAKEEIYRAREKLVYKFISDRLVFAYDNTGALFLNSANILIPKIPHMSVKTVMAFLNSELYSYLYIKLFGEVKILKGNLIKLPFAETDSEMNEKIEKAVDAILCENLSDTKELQRLIYKTFEITQKEIMHIENVLKRK